MAEKLLILEGHPTPDSFCGGLSIAVKQGAKTKGAIVKHIRLCDLTFDENLQGGFGSDQTMEADLQAFWEAILWCDRFVLVHPLWWGAAPAKLKGLFDRSLLPDQAFHYEEGKTLPVGHLKGRVAEVLITADSPGWFLRFMIKNAWHIVLKKQILEFCGFKVRSIRNIGPIQSSTPVHREKYLAVAHKLGVGA